MAKMQDIYVITVKVSSGKTIPHPTINYSSLRSDVEFAAAMSVDVEDDVLDDLVEELQEKAYAAVEKHLARMIEEGEENE